MIFGHYFWVQNLNEAPFLLHLSYYSNKKVPLRESFARLGTSSKLDREFSFYL